jgi:hypothetical protein
MILLRWTPTALLPLTLLFLGTGCSADSENAEVKCSRTLVGTHESPCRVTFERTAPASASILGRDIELLNTANDRVTLKVAGTEIVVTLEDTEAQEANLNITIESITQAKVIVRFSEVDV